MRWAVAYDGAEGAPASRLRPSLAQRARVPPVDYVDKPSRRRATTKGVQFFVSPGAQFLMSFDSGEREPGMERRSGARELVAVGSLDDLSGGGEQADALMEGGGPDPASGAQVGERKRLSGFGERGHDALVERGGGDQPRSRPAHPQSASPQVHVVPIRLRRRRLQQTETA